MRQMFIVVRHRVRPYESFPRKIRVRDSTSLLMNLILHHNNTNTAALLDTKVASLRQPKQGPRVTQLFGCGFNFTSKSHNKVSRIKASRMQQTSTYDAQYLDDGYPIKRISLHE